MSLSHDVLPGQGALFDPEEAGAAAAIEQSCWCCRDYGLATPATEKSHGINPRPTQNDLCGPCANRSPSACKEIHERAGGKTASQRMLEAIEAREREAL
jgi:hypothetical protein